MDLSALLRDSFQLFIKHKQLWFFGILMTIFGGGQYSFGVNYRETTKTSVEATTQSFQQLAPSAMSMMGILQNPLLFIVVALVSSILFWVITLTVSSWSRTAIIGIVKRAEDDAPLSWRTAVQFSFERFRPAWLISMLLGIPGLLMTVSAVLMVAIFLSNFLNLYQQSTSGLLGTFFGIFSSVCFMVCVGNILVFLTEIIAAFAIRAAVIEGLAIIDSFRSVWSLLRKQFGYALVTGIILRFFAGVFGFLVAIPALALWVPTARALMHNQWNETAILLGIAFVIYYIIFSVVVGGALTSFNETLWTKLYLNLVSYTKNNAAVQVQNLLAQSVPMVAVNEQPVIADERRDLIVTEKVSGFEKYFFFLRKPVTIRGWLYNIAFILLLGVSVMATWSFFFTARSVFKEAFLTCSMPVMVLALLFYLNARKIYLKSRNK